MPILLLANKKRHRTNLDMLTNQEEEYYQARRIKRRIFPEVEGELAPLMNKMNLACGRVQGEREQDTAATRKYSSKRKLTNLEEEIRWVKRRTTTEASRRYNVDAPTFNSTSHLSISALACLPTDIVFLILDKLLEPIDRVCFTLVCKEWHSLANQYKRETQRGSTICNYISCFRNREIHGYLVR